MDGRFVPLLLAALLLAAPSRASASAAGTAAAALPDFCPADTAAGPRPSKPIATAEITLGAYAAVGLLCTHAGDYAEVALMHRTAGGWRFLGDSRMTPRDDPFAVRGMPPGVAASLWKAWRTRGAGAYAAPPDPAAVASLRKAVAARRGGSASVRRVIGPWALVDVSFDPVGEGQAVYRQTGRRWTEVVAGGGAMNALYMSSIGMPYAIARRFCSQAWC